jgi:hypothetical protein
LNLQSRYDVSLAQAMFGEKIERDGLRRKQESEGLEVA